ncbi:MAG: glycosyltransferase [Clostridiales bacterium]|nr:glycosyltransferase [Clostridiales bacterium]
MEQEIKISIIMPVYKVERFLRRAIESVQAQTLRNFELLLVDDGSPDRSGTICDEYASRDSRIHVIHEKNKGAAMARNAAMDIATGEYICFMDADDWVEPTMLEDMVHLAKRDQASLVITGFYIDTWYSDSRYVTTDFICEDMVFHRREDFRRNAYRLFDKNMLYSPWNKLFSAQYLKERNLRFPDTFWDDFPFVLSVIRDIERVTVSSRQYYHFIRMREESETALWRPNMYEKREEEHQWMMELYSYWKIADEKSQEMIARRYIERFIGCLENLTNPKCTLSLKDKRQEVRRMLASPHVSWSLRLARPRSAMMRCMLVPVRMKNVSLILLEARIITFVKTRNSRLFAKLKAGR